MLRERERERERERSETDRQTDRDQRQRNMESQRDCGNYALRAVLNYSDIPEGTITARAVF